MIDVKKNKHINAELDNLYNKYTQDFLVEWKKAFNTTPPSRINEFGIINIQKYNTDNGILFICRETNGWDNKDYEKGCLFRNWMCDITEKVFKDKSHIKQHPNMWYNIGRWVLLIKSPDTPIEELSSLKKETIKHIGQIAFTNINKVRGSEQSKKEYNRLAKSSVVGEVLKKEIQIINPKVIVCCGTGTIFDKHIQNYSGKVIYMPHPASRKKKKDLLMELKKQL